MSELETELSALYEPENRHGLSLDALFQPHIRFFVAYSDGLAAGCGGVALFSNFAEVKRMYVRPNARGRGIADAIMVQLSREAAKAGLKLLRLETGTHQYAALSFYRRCGFEQCGIFAPYSSMRPEAVATSVFMEKQL